MLILLTAFAVVLSFGQVPTIQVNPVATYNLSKHNTNGNWRAGLAFDFFHKGNLRIQPVVMVDTFYADRLYAGAVVEYTLVKKHNFELGPVVSYTTDISSLRHINNGQWGVGLEARFRF